MEALIVIHQSRLAYLRITVWKVAHGWGCSCRYGLESCLLEDCVVGVAHLEHSSVWLDGDPGWGVWVAEASLEDLGVVSDH